MSISGHTHASNWRSVSSADPCPICGKPDWCSVSTDGSVAMCRRIPENAYHSAADKNGTPYYLHRLRGERPANDTPAATPQCTGVDRADPDTRHQVYSALLGALSLSQAHRENLHRRGLIDAEIDRRGYRSLPIRGRAQVARKLEAQFGAGVLTVPGIHRKKPDTGGYITLAGAAGLLIPVRDAGGRIIALKIRRDAGGHAGRYSYMSSTKQGGVGPGTPLHVSLGMSSPAARIRLTEGELKADIAFALTGLPTISVPGVCNWQEALKLLKALSCETVVLAMDMDAAVKPPVARAVLACAEALVQAGFALQLERWDIADGKGIDDLLAGGKQPEVLEGDAARAAIREMACAAGVSDGAGARASAQGVLNRLRAVLESDDPAGLYRDDGLLDKLAKLSVDDQRGFAAVRQMLRLARLSVREFDRAIEDARHRVIESRPPVPARGETGGFTVANGCICRERIVGESVVHIQLSNFSAAITDETIRDDGVDHHIMFGVAGTLADGTMLPRAEVAAADYADLDWVAEQWGAQPIIWPGERLALGPAIQALSDEIVRRTVYTHTGWRDVGDNQWVYLHAGGAIGADGSVADIRVDLPQSLAGYQLPLPVNNEHLVDAIRASLRLLDLAPDHITFPLLAYAYRAPLGATDSSLHLAGPTGVYKSEVAALTQRHYGAGLDARNLPANWASTGNALEALAFAAKDALIVIDDFSPTGTQSDVQRLHREADRILRAQGNHAGRQRLNRDSSLRAAKPPRGSILSTGEDVPAGQSLRARLLTLELGPGDVDRVQLTACQGDADAGLYAHAMAAYIRWLAPQYADIRRRLRDEVSRLRAQAISGEVHARTPEIAANLAVGLRYLLAFAVEVGALSQAAATQLWERGWQALIAAATAQASHHADMEPTGKFLRLVGAAIASGRAHVTAPAGGYLGDASRTWGWMERVVGSGMGREWQPQGRRIGWLDGEDLYLEPEAAYATAQGLAREQGDHLAVSACVLWRRLAERGLLVTTEAGRQRRTVRRMLERVRRDVLHLAAASIHLPEPQAEAAVPDGTDGTVAGRVGAA